MRASWIFSKNDVLANLGVILASVLIYFTGSRWPDLAIGLVITFLVMRGGFAILKEAREEAECPGTAEKSVRAESREAGLAG